MTHDPLIERMFSFVCCFDLEEEFDVLNNIFPKVHRKLYSTLDQICRFRIRAEKEFETMSDETKRMNLLNLRD